MLTLEQKKIRKTGIGASEAAAVLGVSKWKTPMQVYLDKLDPNVEEDKPTKATDRGNALEPVIIHNFEQVTGKKVSLTKETFRHPDYHYMLCHIDGATEDAIVEAKSVSIFSDMVKEYGEDGTDQMAQMYYIQCAHINEIFESRGVNKVYSPTAFVNDNTGIIERFAVYVYERRVDVGQTIIESIGDFWNNNVLKQVPPQPKDYEDSVRIWKTNCDGSTKMVTPEKMFLLKEIKKLKASNNDTRKELKPLEDELKDFMGYAKHLTDEQGVNLATWGMYIQTRFDERRFALEEPEKYKKYLKNMPVRKLFIKGVKDE